MNAQMLVGLILLCLLLAAWGAGLLLLRLRFYLTGIWADGTFVDWQKRGFWAVYYYARVRFETRGGTEHEASRGLRYKWPQTPKSSYRVLYRTHAPERGVVYSALAFWSWPVACLLLAWGLSGVLLREIGGWDSFVFHYSSMLERLADWLTR